jgi:hypothetical protein
VETKIKNPKLEDKNYFNEIRMSSYHKQSFDVVNSELKRK